MINIRVLLVLLLSPFIGMAQDATSNFVFTQIPVSAPSTAFGGGQVAVFSSELNQLIDNPALADSSIDKNISLSYLNYVTDVQQTSAGYGQYADSLGFFSGYLRYMDYGSIKETDEVGNVLREFKTTEYEVGVSWTRQYSERITYGATWKQVFSGMYKRFAYGIAFDFGGYYHTPNGLSFGMTIDDLGARLIDYNQEPAALMRPSINLGVAKKFEKAPLHFGLQYSNIETWDLAANDLDQSDNLSVDQLTGESERKTLTFDNFARHLSLSVMLTPSEKFAVMGGFDFRRRLELSIEQRPALIGFSFGTRINLKRFAIQYAVNSYHINGAIHNLSVSTNLNKWYSKKTM